MRRIQSTMLAGALFAAAACTDYSSGLSGNNPAPPTGLTYELQPSGDPNAPLGILLRWDEVTDPQISSYNVYSRNTANGSFGLRAQTTSPSFHEAGSPAYEYFVTVQDLDGSESDPSGSVTIDASLRLPSPASLTSITLNGAIHLQWADNAYQSDPAGFWYYRVYSSSYDLDSNLCGVTWSVEGTTVAPTFLAGALVNGQPRCFAVSAISIEGFESIWSPKRYDTPRYDAQSVIVYTTAGDPNKSGFRFWLDANADNKVSPLELGLVSAGASPSLDFTVQASGPQLLLVPVRAAVTFQQYGTQVISALTAIDVAPVGGYARTNLPAQPGFGYVFQMLEADGFFRYGAIRVSALGANYVVFDWSYQSDFGNPELIRALSRAGG